MLSAWMGICLSSLVVTDARHRTATTTKENHLHKKMIEENNWIFSQNILRDFFVVWFSFLFFFFLISVSNSDLIYMGRVSIDWLCCRWWRKKYSKNRLTIFSSLLMHFEIYIVIGSIAFCVVCSVCALRLLCWRCWALFPTSRANGLNTTDVAMIVIKLYKKIPHVSYWNRDHIIIIQKGTQNTHRYSRVAGGDTRSSDTNMMDDMMRAYRMYKV